MNIAPRNKTLFVLDDDAIFHRILTLANKQVFFKHIFHHYDVKSLMAYLWKNRNDHSNLPDVIFADLSLPINDGWCFLNAYEKLRNMLCKNIVVYVVSVSIRKVDSDRVANYSFVKQYITKPISMNQFREIAEEKAHPSFPLL
ncbi:MAG: response regulator [Bacteroidota bacterium]